MAHGRAAPSEAAPKRQRKELQPLERNGRLTGVPSTWKEDHGEVEGARETAKFRTAATEEDEAVVDPVAPWLGVDVVEEDEGVAVMLVLLARLQKLHIVLSTATRLCCSTPNANFFREEDGELIGENGGGGEGKEGGI